jgi:hypothetical protein
MKEIASALVKAQLEMSNATKDAKNPFFKSSYADLNSIREAVIPSLNKNGITVLQPIVQTEGKSYVKTVLLHTSGETVETSVEIVTSKPNDPQALGSAISYGRRYGLQALMCVGAVDDDGEAGMGRGTNTSSSTSTTSSNTTTQTTGSTDSKGDKKPFKGFAKKPVISTEDEL